MMRFRDSGRFSLLVAAAAALLFLAPQAHAQKWEFGISGSGVPTGELELEQPRFPGGNIRSGQEGWVRMSFVIGPDGSAMDPLVIDSSGGNGFEEEARKVTGKWHFESLDSPAERPNNLVNIRSEIFRGRDLATSNFMRRYRRIVTHLHNEENEDARKLADSAYQLGGWNLYESAMLWLMLGRVEGAEGNLAGKLEFYRRAHGIAETIKLKKTAQIDLLEKIFTLEDHFGQSAGAMRTYAELQRFLGTSPMNELLEARSAEIRAKIDGDEAITAQATIYSACDCEEGQPLWYYKPARRTFSFANLSGNVQSFEARCDYKRVQGSVDVGTQWTLAPDWGSCRVFVFGDDGATFEFIEHPTDAEDGAPNAVAKDDVLDRRNRGQRS